MAINKIVLNTDTGEQVLVDLTGDTVNADSLVVGSVAHGADGEVVEGANPYELETTNAEVGTQTDLIAQIQTALESKAAPSGGITPTGTIEITENGTHDVTAYASAEVNVPPDEPVLQNKTITENGTYSADEGYDGLGTVEVNVPSSGGAEVYYSGMGQMYTPHMVIPNGGMRYARDHFQNAVHLVSFIQQYGTPASDSDYGLFRGCTALETVWVSRATFGAYVFGSCSALKTITLGRVGLAVTSLNTGMWDYTVKNVETITCYVNATTLAEIPTAVSGRILPSASPNATIIYRNSTTGEIISA